MPTKKTVSKKTVGDAIVIVVFGVLMTLIGGFSGYSIGIKHSTQPPKPEPYTINGYPSESDFDAVFAQTTWDRLDAERSDMQININQLNRRIDSLELTNRNMQNEIRQLQDSIAKLVAILQYSGINMDSGVAKAVEPSNSGCGY